MGLVPAGPKSEETVEKLCNNLINKSGQATMVKVVKSLDSFTAFVLGAYLLNTIRDNGADIEEFFADLFGTLNGDYSDLECFWTRGDE